MPLTLKSTGLAAEAVFVLAVDDDDTIREFVSPSVNAAKTLGTGVAASVAAGEWKGASRRYWSSAANGPFDYHGVRFAVGNRPALPQSNAAGWTAVHILHSISAPSNDGGLLSWTASANGGRGGTRRSSLAPNGLAIFNFASERGASSTTLPVGSTKFFSAVAFRDAAGVGATFYYALESDANLTADGTSTAGVGWMSAAADVYGVGGFEGQGNQPAARYADMLFNRQLSQPEIETLHDDWFNVLFESAGPSFQASWSRNANQGIL